MTIGFLYALLSVHLTMSRFQFLSSVLSALAFVKNKIKINLLKIDFLMLVFLYFFVIFLKFKKKKKNLLSFFTFFNHNEPSFSLPFFFGFIALDFYLE